MPDGHYDVLIVGGGHGGAQAAAMLRQQQFGGSLAVLGDEPEQPYERPPLSKDYLLGEKSFDRILIRPAAFWSDRKIDLLLGHRVASVEPDAHIVTTANEKQFGYGKLIWATGGTARRLTCAGHRLEGVYTLRTRADADAIALRVQQVRKVVVIGGGYIGLETAAVLSKLGKRVTVLEAQDRVLARVAGEPLSRFYEAEHRAHGVDVRLGAVIECIEGESGAASGVRLSSGVVLDAELVIVGIGIVPAVQPLLDAGAVGGNGVDVDSFCRTSLADIFAIGDCASHKNSFADGQAIRLESVQNANDQASTVAKAIVGINEAYNAVPWFWSNQYDLRLQTIGLSIGYDDVITRGTPEDRSFSLIYLRGRRVRALDCVNATKDYVQGRALVMNGSIPDLSRLSDASVSLKDVVCD